jgi:hypothetical protein
MSLSTAVLLKSCADAASISLVLLRSLKKYGSRPIAAGQTYNNLETGENRGQAGRSLHSTRRNIGNVPSIGGFRHSRRAQKIDCNTDPHGQSARGDSGRGARARTHSSSSSSQSRIQPVQNSRGQTERLLSCSVYWPPGLPGLTCPVCPVRPPCPPLAICGCPSYPVLIGRGCRFSRSIINQKSQIKILLPYIL